MNIYASLDLATSLATKASIKKAATNPSKYSKARDIAAKSAPNNTIFLKAPSAKTKGLKSTKVLKTPGKVSIGSIVFEKNSIKLAAATAPKVDVSSFLNIYPINIPNNIKAHDATTKTSNELPNIAITSSLKKNIENPSNISI